MSACLASLLELPLQLVPDFAAETDTDDEFHRAIEAWLAKKGLRYRQTPIGPVPPVGWHVIEGRSPRGGQHAVLGRDGWFVFDPHPPEDDPRRGLVEEQRWGFVEPLDRVEDQKPGEKIKLPNGRRATVEKVTPARNLFGEEELHVKTTTGEVLPVKKER